MLQFIAGLVVTDIVSLISEIRCISNPYLLQNKSMTVAIIEPTWDQC